MSTTTKKKKSSKVTKNDTGDKSSADARYTIVGDERVAWDGPAFMSWHDLANELTVQDAIAVELAATTEPFPTGKGKMVLGKARAAARVAVSTNAGRQLDMFEAPRAMTDLELAACELLLKALRGAADERIHHIAYLRRQLSERSMGKANAPYDCYIRLALGVIDIY